MTSINHRTPLNHMTMTSTSALNSSRPPTQMPAMNARVVWLRPVVTKPQYRLNHLVERFSQAGMDVWIVNGSELPLEQMLCFDLILLESFGVAKKEMQPVLYRIRLGSRAPLVLLSDERSVDWKIQALRAGADAILSMTTSADVILARCQALLRRWAPELEVLG